MFDIVDGFSNSSNQWFNILLLTLAVVRVYLELVKFDFSELPMTKAMFPDRESAVRFHRSGLYLSLGYIVLSAPFTLFA